MPTLSKLLERNRAWAESVVDHNPDFFAKLAEQQTPDYLWIGCSDSLHDGHLRPLQDVIRSNGNDT